MVGFTHVSVMPIEVLHHWVTDPQGIYVDATVGAGGHSRLLLEQFPQASVIGLDQDPLALAEARVSLAAFGDRVRLLSANFRHLADAVATNQGVVPLAGVLFDLGVSSPQFDVPERGFSYHFDAPLDMRMDPQNPVTAFRLVNMKSQQDIAFALKTYGEEPWASRIAEFVVRARQVEPIRTTGQLVEIIKAAIPAARRRTGGHPARRTFQALRIWVNDELGALDEGLNQARAVLASGGRIVVVSFHSLEDRMVKHRFRQWQQEGAGQVITRHPLLPQPSETQSNPRARSAKLRVYQH